ncbi:restriction endonuclease subunit S [Streptomyces melanogenes]|uniref:restriction endonuclease subunit S n=1 Tax=Streptomyces melanogenes TaxID=67326 RepID=UPI0037BE06B3
MAEKGGKPGLLAKHPSWERVKCGDIVEIVNGFPFRSSGFNVDRRGTPVIRIRDLLSGATSTFFDGDFDPVFMVSRGDLLVGMDGDFRVARWKGEEALLNQRVCKLVVRDEKLFDGRFLMYVLQGYLKAIQDLTSAVTVKHLSSRTIQEIPLPLPPLAEQHRIVEALEEQLSRLDAAEQVLRGDLVRVRLLAARVANFAASRAVPAGEETAPPPRQADAIDRDLPRIPASWSWERLGDIADVVGGVTKDMKKQDDPDFAEVPYLRVANVQRGWLNLDHVATIRVPDRKADDLRLQSGDVLMNEGGDRDKLGRGWIWQDEVKDAIHQNHVFRARVRGGAVLPKLLAHHANSSARWFEVNGKQTTNLASISLKKIRNLPIPVPPAGEQIEILQQVTDQLEGLARVGAALEVGIKRAATLRSALLRKAFSGNLLPQDPADEPATVLLARIAAAREAVKPARRAKRAASPRRTAASCDRAIADAPAAPAPTPAPSATVQQELFQ